MSTQKASTGRASTVIERTYRTRVEELWRLWTTKEGFESWWGSEGSRVEVHTIEAREGGTLRYDMIAVAPAHNEEFTRTSIRIFTSQLEVLEARFQGQ